MVSANSSSVRNVAGIRAKLRLTPNPFLPASFAYLWIDPAA
jgi:hypothetical protein